MSAVLRPQPWFQPLVEEELDAVIAIEREIYEFPWTRGNFQDSLRAGYSCWACHGSEGLGGYAVLMLAAGEAHLLNLSVAAFMQGQGIGTCLLEHVIGVSRDYGARVMFLEVRPSNAAARRLYRRRGFQQVGVRCGYYPARDGREDALVLSLAL